MSLWQTLSVGLARTITLSGQVGTMVNISILSRDYLQTAQILITFLYNFQEPFHTLNNELLAQLTKSQQEELDQVLPKCDLDCLLGTLYEFIETFIRHIDMGKKEWG